MRRHLLFLTMVLAGMLVVPAVAGAASYRFKVAEFKLRQEVIWDLSFRDVDCEAQSSGDYYVHTGNGVAALKSDNFIRRGRVTFKTGRGGLLPARITGRAQPEFPNLRGAFAYRAAMSDWKVAYQDDPSSDCAPRPELGRPDTSCAKEQDPNRDPQQTWPGGMLQAHLMFVRGKVRLTGAFYAFDLSRTCSDPSAVSSAVSHAVPTKRGVAKLIRNRRVRKIRLTASKKGRLSASQLATPGGSFKVLGGEGAEYTARWSLTLVRLP